MADEKVETKVQEKTAKTSPRKKISTDNTQKKINTKTSQNSKTTKPKSSTNKETKKKVANNEEKKEQKMAKKSKIKPSEITEIDMKKMKTVLEKEAESSKISKEDLNKINKRLFSNIFLAIVIVVYLNFIILGFLNIENAVFLTDLKVFSLSILAIAIGVFEYAYKKDSGTLAIYGIEVLVLALITIAFIYLNLMLKNKFIPIAMLIAYIYSIYYTVKALIIYIKLKKQYSINNIKEITKRKED